MEARSLQFSELAEARDDIADLFDLLTLGVKYLAFPPEYDPDVVMARQPDGRGDIDEVLDSLARSSHLVNLPEYNPALWQVEASRMSSDDRRLSNDYRRRFGLPEA